MQDDNTKSCNDNDGFHLITVPVFYPFLCPSHNKSISYMKKQRVEKYKVACRSHIVNLVAEAGFEQG